MIMPIKGILKKSVIFLVLISGILISGTFSYADVRNQGLAPAPEYSKNASGETYGSELKAISPETEPDLTEAIA